MALPLLIGLIRVGTVVYKVAKNKAAQEMARNLIKKGFGKATQSAGKKPPKNLTASKASEIIATKTPTVSTRIGSALKTKSNKVTKGSPGAEKGSIVVGSTRTGARKTGDKVIGGGVIAIPAGAGIAYLKDKLNDANADIKESKSAEARAKARADKEIINAALAKAMLEDKESSAPKKSVNPKTRSESSAPIESKRPRKRPANLKDGGMPMVMKDGKKIPAYAADGVGKMMKGGMPKKKKAASNYAYGGMAKAKPRTGNTDYRMGGMFMKSGKK